MKTKEGFLLFFLMESVKPDLFPSVPLLHHREVIPSILREGWGVLERQCLGVCAHSGVQISVKNPGPLIQEALDWGN